MSLTPRLINGHAVSCHISHDYDNRCTCGAARQPYWNPWWTREQFERYHAGLPVYLSTTPPVSP